MGRLGQRGGTHACEDTVFIQQTVQKFCKSRNRPANLPPYEQVVQKQSGYAGGTLRELIPVLKQRFSNDDVNNALRWCRRQVNGQSAPTPPRKQRQKMTKAATIKSKSTSTKRNATTNNKQKYAIDTHIEKSFPTNYTGKITSYDGRKKAPYGVTYDDDNEVEYMTEKEVAQHIVSRRRGMKRAAKPSTSSNDSEPRPAKKSKGTQTPPQEDDDDVMDETTVDTSTKQRATRSSKKANNKQQQSSNKRNTRSNSSGNSDEGSGNNEKGGDEQPPTNKGGDKVADKENDTLDTNKDKEEGSPDLVDDSSGDKDDQHDLQFSDDEGGGGGDMLMQSPAKSTSSTRSEITTTMSTEITSMLQGIIQKAMSKLDLRAVHLLGQAMGQVSTNIITPLENGITDIEDEITNTKQLIEFQKSLQSQASKKLPTGIDLGIDINDMDTVKEKNTRILEGKENEKAEKLAKLQTINDNRPAIKKLFLSTITSCFTAQSESYVLQPSLDDDNDTDGIESYVIDESTGGIGQIVSELETECEDFVNLLMSVYVKNLEEEKANYLDELEGNDADRFDYYSLQEKCKKILRSLRTTEGNFEHFRQERLCYEDGPAAYEKEFPGQVKFWTDKANELDSKWEVAARKHDDVYKQVLAYRAENDIKLQEMLTIKIGSVTIQPPPESLDEDGENDNDDEEDDGGNAETQDALYNGQRGR